MRSIKLGIGALEGIDDFSCSLLMEDLPNLSSISCKGYNFYYPRFVTLSNIPNLQTVHLLDSFQYVESKSVTNVSPILADLVQIQSQNYINNGIQTVNRQMRLQVIHVMDSGLSSHNSMNNRIRGYHMNRRYYDRQMRHGYHNSSFLNWEVHKNGVISKMYDRYIIEQFHKLEINK